MSTDLGVGCTFLGPGTPLFASPNPKFRNLRQLRDSPDLVIATRADFAADARRSSTLRDLTACHDCRHLLTLPSLTRIPVPVPQPFGSDL